MIKSDIRIGDLLIKEGLITQSQLDQALAEQKKSGGKVGEVLIRLQLVAPKDIAQALSKQLGVLYASIEKGLLRPNLHQGLEKLIPEDYARYHKLFLCPNI